MGTAMETFAHATRDGLATAARSVLSQSTARPVIGSALRLTRAMGEDFALSRMALASATLGGRENHASGILQDHMDLILPVRGIKTAAGLVTV